MITRNFVLIAAGWFLVCGAQFAAGHPNSSPRPTPGATSTAITPFPGYSIDPCYKSKDRDVADRCAQWKAADAAKSSADATWWTVYLAGLGIGLGTITMAAAIAAAYFAKKAADETKRGANAAHDANRPWLDVDLKLHSVCVNYDGKGYSLQLEVTPLNAGASPASDVREHVECLFYDQIPKDNDPYSLSFTGRDQALQKRAVAVAAKLGEERDAGPTVFPGRDQPFYIETFVPWDFNDGFPTALAWLIVGLRYSFPEGAGETIKVFSVRSFGFPNHGGFECMGTEPFATVKADPAVAVWPRYGYVK